MLLPWASMRILIASIMLAICSAAPPATAHSTTLPAKLDDEIFWRGAPSGPLERIDYLQSRIDRGLADRSLDESEGVRIRSELFQIRQMVKYLKIRNNARLPRSDLDYIQSRLDTLARTIRWVRRKSS